MPSTPVRPLSNHLVINTHNLSQAHNRGSPRSANAQSAISFKEPLKPPMEKRHSYGPSSLGPGGPGGGGHNGFHGHGHLGHGHARSRQSLALTALRIVAGAPGFLGMMYSLSKAWDRNSADQQQQHRHQEGSYQSISDDPLLTRSDFWIASMWASYPCGLSIYWSFLLTTASIQRLLQSYRPPNVVLRISLAHLLSWTLIGIVIRSRPATEPTRPWVIITFAQALLLVVIVYLPWFKSQMQAAGFPKLSERLTSHALEDGFMGRDITGRSATRFLILPLVVVGLCSWMLIITRGHQTNLQENGQGQLIQEVSPSNGRLPSNVAGSFLSEADRQQDGRMVILMIVLSSATPQGYLNRKMFRETTLKLFPSPRNKAVVVKYRFIVGDPLPAVEREIEQEHNLMRDLLIVSAPDTADSKSMKLYKAIEWSDQFDFDYIVKTDDDVLVRMDTLSGELYKQGKKPYFWKGLVFKNVPNTRLDDMDLKEMPKFTDGTLTTLSRDIVRLLAMPAPRYFVASSAQSLGIWLHGYGIKPVHDTRIQPGAFVCEEDLIAKHFDNEPSLLLQPRDDPIKMVERINIIRSELKKNKDNPKFRTTTFICDQLIQKRCAMCYSCQGRASNWKLMGFDCKQGGVVVGDKYRKPELLDAKQMDELLNRPPGGVSDDLEYAPLKDYRPESRNRQLLQSSNQADAQEEAEEDAEEATGEDETLEEDDAENDEQGVHEQEETLVPQDEEDSDLAEEQDLTEHVDHDESEMPISDQEVDYINRRHDEEALPKGLKQKKAARRRKD
ncbi:UDP-Gal betaGal beta 1,3-galactosyltransferase, polypeptide 6 [Mortierella alpina]|nr:UDP-Gal betaGal beta 1,3-galactosyltransferase, polypeptide 6 [Mortierella alpina]